MIVDFEHVDPPPEAAVVAAAVTESPTAAAATYPTAASAATATTARILLLLRLMFMVPAAAATLQHPARSGQGSCCSVDGCLTEAAASRRAGADMFGRDDESCKRAHNAAPSGLVDECIDREEPPAVES